VTLEGLSTPAVRAGHFHGQFYRVEVSEDIA
jgi:hypothetical protein